MAVTVSLALHHPSKYVDLLSLHYIISARHGVEYGSSSTSAHRKPYFLRLPQNTATRTLYLLVVSHATCIYGPSSYIIQVVPSWFRSNPLELPKVNHESTHCSNYLMVGTTSKYPFFNSFIAGVLSVIFVGALTFIGFFSWRYFRNRRRLERANNSIALTILEDGLKASDSSDISSRSPSRLGGISPSSVKRAAGARETQSQYLVQPGTTNSAGKRPVLVVSQRTSSIINPLTTKGVGRHDGRTNRAEDSSNGATWGNNGDTTTERAQPRSSAYASRPRMRPVPPVPLTPTTRLSVSTVWSQESMWSREKRPDVPVPPLPHMPPLAHMQVPRRVTFSPDMASGSQNRRSTSSLPRSVGQSDFEDYI